MMDKISVICPTYNREELHPRLYQIFVSQTYPEKELLIYDDSEAPSPFFENLKDPRVQYFYSPERLSIGSKRNRLIAQASSEIIAHFDDDDFYAPLYLEKLREKLGEADFIKLSKWYAWQEAKGILWLWNTEKIEDIHYRVSGALEPVPHHNFKQRVNRNFLLMNLWGYGFSYLYRKKLWEVSPFRDESFSEDYHFVVDASRHSLLLKYTPDLSSLALHIIHKNNVSLIFPQEALDATQALAIFGEEIKPWLVTC